MTQNLEMKPAVVFIHGAFVTPLCWEKFIPFFEQRGFECHAPAWPSKDKSVSEIQASPDPELAKAGVTEIVDRYDRFIRTFPEPPILIGHSFGGLFVQILLDRGLGRGGVAIDPAPPKGVLPFYPSVIRSLFPILATLGGWRRIVRLSPRQFHYAFCHTFSDAELNAVYRRYVTPETGRIFFQTAFSMFHNATRVNFKNSSRAPLLLIGAEKDHVCPLSQIRVNTTRQRQSKARTDFLEFKGLTHWLIAQPGWEKVAGSITDWISVVALGPGHSCHVIQLE